MSAFAGKADMVSTSHAVTGRLPRTVTAHVWSESAEQSQAIA